MTSMASSEDKRSKSQTSFSKILNRQDEKLEGQALLARSVEMKRGLLDIDLNVAPPEDDGPESPEADDGCVGEETLQAAANFNETVEVRDEVFKVKSANRNEIEGQNTVIVSEKEKEKMEMRKNRRWDALLEAAKNALRDYEESVGNEEGKAQNRKRGPSREVGIGGGRKKICNEQRWNGAAEFMAAAPVVVARSTRARAVAMPNKYRDSVLHAAAAVAEARFSRHNVKRKFR